MLLSSDIPVGFFIFAGIIVIGIVGSIYSYLAAEKRREGLIDLARRLGLRFSAEPDYAIADQYDFLKELTQGENQYAFNVCSGTYRGYEVLAFDYHYETVTHDKNGRHTHDHYFSFFILQLPGLVPDLTIRRESFFTKIAEVFGYQDIKFESAEFSKAFNVRSADKKFAYDVCNPQMMEYLLANRDLSIEFENQALAFAFDDCLSPEQFEVNLNRLVEIRSRMPGYLFPQNA